MKILFLSHYFPPEVNAPASRTYDHCLEWAKKGHTVDVITCAPNHPKGQVFPGYKNKLYQTEQKNGINIIRIWTYITANEGFLKRTLNYFSYLVSAVLASLTVLTPDVVISTSPQFFNGLAGYFVSKIRRAPWILEIRDLWPDSILAVGAMKKGSLIRLPKWIERFMYEHSDHIVVVTESFKLYMIEMGIPEAKISVIKNGVDFTLFSDNPVAEESLTEEIALLQNNLRKKFVAAYVGTHGMAHHLQTVLQSAKLTENNDSLHYLLVGDGAERESLLRLKQKLNLTNVTMLGLQPKAAMPSIWKLSNVSLVMLKDDPVFSSVIPSKIFESLAMKKPIILAVRGEAADLVAASGGGIVIAPEDPRLLADALLRLEENDAEYRQLAESGYKFVLENFDRSKLAERFVEQMQAAVNGQKQSLSSSQKLKETS